MLIRNHAYLLQHRDNIDHIADPDTYGAWGGSIERADISPAHAAVRELKEETGLNIPIKQLSVLGDEIHDARAPENKGTRVKFYFFAVHLDDSTDFEPMEGQGVVALPIPCVYNPKVNHIAQRAIDLYEAFAL